MVAPAAAPVCVIIGSGTNRNAKIFRLNNSNTDRLAHRIDLSKVCLGLELAHPRERHPDADDQFKVVAFMTYRGHRRDRRSAGKLG
jgi:hypothetical protein